MTQDTESAHNQSEEVSNASIDPIKPRFFISVDSFYTSEKCHRCYLAHRNCKNEHWKPDDDHHKITPNVALKIRKQKHQKFLSLFHHDIMLMKEKKLPNQTFLDFQILDKGKEFWLRKTAQVYEYDAIVGVLENLYRDMQLQTATLPKIGFYLHKFSKYWKFSKKIGPEYHDFFMHLKIHIKKKYLETSL